MFDSFKKIADGVTELIEPLNPMVTDMTQRNKEIATNMIAAGLTTKEIQDFVDVSRSQLDAYLAVEAEVERRIASMGKDKQPA